MSRVRLLHCADLHLGARMTTHLDPRRAKERREELLLTFGRIVETAAERQVQAVLLVGDLFDTARVTVSTRRYVGQLIADYPAITFLYVSGNHDRDVQPLFPEDRIPHNWVDLSGEQWSSRMLPCELPVTVSGTSALESEATYQTLPTVQGYHIVMLHGQVSTSMVAARDVVCLPQLSGRGIDYLALGHLHSYRCEALDARGVWCYSGCPEGRGFDECGVKGVVLLELCEDETSPTRVRAQQEFLPIAKRTLHRIAVTVGEQDNARTLTARVAEATEEISERDIVLVELVGEVAPEQGPDTQNAALMLADRFFAARLEDATTLSLRAEDYLHDVSLKGEFIRAVMAAGLPERERDRVILCGLRALRGEEAAL